MNSDSIKYFVHELCTKVETLRKWGGDHDLTCWTSWCPTVPRGPDLRQGCPKKTILIICRVILVLGSTDALCSSVFMFAGRFLEMHMYMTSALSKNDMKAIGLQMALDLLAKKEKKDSITGLRTRTQPGRPEWGKVRFCCQRCRDLFFQILIINNQNLNHGTAGRVLNQTEKNIYF